MSTVSGKSFTECFSFASRVGGELEGLMETLSNLFVEGLKQTTLPCFITGEGKWDNCLDQSQWVNKDTSWCVRLKGPSKRNKPMERYLGFQVSVMGEGIAILGNEEPLLHISFWHAPYDFEDEVAAYFPTAEAEDWKLTVISERLLRWNIAVDPKWHEQEWTFSLRVTELNSADDLQTYVVDPALALINGARAEDALPDAWFETALIRYPNKQQLLA